MYGKYHILWPTTQKPTLRSQNSKISCLDPISTPSGQLWISKNSKFPILSFCFQWILNINTFYFWGVIVSTPSQDLWFFGSAARCGEYWISINYSQILFKRSIKEDTAKWKIIKLQAKENLLELCYVLL